MSVRSHYQLAPLYTITTNFLRDQAGRPSIGYAGCLRAGLRKLVVTGPTFVSSHCRASHHTQCYHYRNLISSGRHGRTSERHTLLNVEMRSITVGLRGHSNKGEGAEAVSKGAVLQNHDAALLPLGGLLLRRRCARCTPSAPLPLHRRAVLRLLHLRAAALFFCALSHRLQQQELQTSVEVAEPWRRQWREVLWLPAHKYHFGHFTTSALRV